MAHRKTLDLFRGGHLGIVIGFMAAVLYRLTEAPKNKHTMFKKLPLITPA
jgi:hypothetical protein